MIDEITNNCWLMIAICALIFIISWPFFGFVVAKHFDHFFPKFVKDKNKMETGYWILNPVLRGATYAGCMLFKNASTKRPYCFYHFQGFDFRAHARRSDWIVLVTFLGSNAMILVFGGIIFVINGFHLPHVSQ